MQSHMFVSLVNELCSLRVLRDRSVSNRHFQSDLYLLFLGDLPPYDCLHFSVQTPSLIENKALKFAFPRLIDGVVCFYCWNSLYSQGSLTALYLSSFRTLSYISCAQCIFLFFFFFFALDFFPLLKHHFWCLSAWKFHMYINSEK